MKERKVMNISWILTSIRTNIQILIEANCKSSFSFFRNKGI